MKVCKTCRHLIDTEPHVCPSAEYTQQRDALVTAAASDGVGETDEPLTGKAKPVGPMPGDLVICPQGSDDPWVKAGDVGVIQGMVGESRDDYLICFGAYSTYRDRSVQSSGGPAYYLATAALLPTEETRTWTFWRWKDTPRAGGGVEYDHTSRVWRLAGRRVYRRAECRGDAWRAFIQVMRSGETFEIDREMYDYWLGVLPPVRWGGVTRDGQPYDFAFAEGCDVLTAFWRQGERYFGRHLTEEGVLYQP